MYNKIYLYLKVPATANPLSLEQTTIGYAIFKFE